MLPFREIFCSSFKKQDSSLCAAVEISERHSEGKEQLLNSECGDKSAEMHIL